MASNKRAILKAQIGGKECPTDRERRQNERSRGCRDIRASDKKVERKKERCSKSWKKKGQSETGRVA